MEERLIVRMREVEEQHWWFAGRREVLLGLVGTELREGARLLDVGCGTGFFLEAAAGRYEVSGLDPSQQSVEFCRKRGLGVVQGDLEVLRDLDPEYDAVVLFDVIEHLADDLAALTLARQVLHPGGCVFVSVPAHRWLWSHHDDTHGHQRRYTRGLLGARMTAAGFHRVRTGYFNARLFPLAVLVRGVQRLTGRGLEADLQPPVEPFNRLFRALLSGEARRLGRPGSTGYPFGLSIFGVGVA